MNELKTIQSALECLHISSNAVMFFLTCYKLGRSSIGQVAKAAKMDRSSAYVAYDTLQQFGLMEETLKGKRKVVWTREPKAVIARLRTEIRMMRRHVDSIEESMPQLLAQYGSRNDRPILQTFTGIDGLHQVMEDILAGSNFELFLMSNFKEEERVFSQKDHEDFIKRRIAKGIDLRLIATDSHEARKIQKDDTQNKRETRIIVGQEPFKNEIYIYGDKIAMLSFNEKTGIIGFIVQSKEFADAQRWMFEQMWQQLGFNEIPRS
jgi:sugar-specific transcriptional regulator TrmB